MPFKTTTANKVLDKILKNTDFTPATSIYVSIHSGDPGETGANEITAYDGDRKQVTMSTAASKSSNNSAANVDFENMPSVTVTHGGLWSAATGGDFWWGGALATQRTVSAGDTFRFPQSTGIVVTLT